ncbi:MAG: TatD family hydrolase [Clostridiales bacterium]|jgi:TatD DNase family protein|nr:TatD family hydrolase [Clostridiales bacterium]
MLIDTHAHLNDPRYKDNYKDIIQDLPRHNVGRIICASYDKQSSSKACKIASEFDIVYFSVGTHPHNAKDFVKDDLKFYQSFADQEKLVAIGEIGLDYHYNFSPKYAQKSAFLYQLEMAHILGLPVIVHSREAYDDTLKILDDNQEFTKNGILVHCYTGDLYFAQEILKRGFYLSFGGAITYKNNHLAYEVITNIPLDKVVLETDCPYLTPMPHRGKINEPKHIKYVAEKIAEWKNIAAEQVEQITAQNAYDFFKKMK